MKLHAYYKDLQYKLSEDLKEIRRKKNISLEELSKQTNVHISQLKDLEMGNVSDIGFVVLVARKLGYQVYFEFIGKD